MPPFPALTYFYPRPPRGGRLLRFSVAFLMSSFLSTPSARRATCLGRPSRSPAMYFYPRPPRGGRHYQMRQTMENIKFLSTPSARRATHRSQHCHNIELISIHALREEGDRHQDGPVRKSAYFYPRPPRGGRRPNWCKMIWAGIFLSTPSARRATAPVVIKKEPVPNFYPRPPRGGRPVRPRRVSIDNDFYPRPPRGGRRPAPGVSRSGL